MADAESRGFNISKERMSEHYSLVGGLAMKERNELETEIDDAVSSEHREDYARLAASFKKEDRDEAARMRRDLRFKKLDLWRATNVQYFLEGGICDPGSEFLTYAWLQEENEYCKVFKAENVADEKVINDKITSISSCILDMNRRFPLGIPTFKVAESFLKALPNLVQGPIDLVHGTVSKLVGNK
ncbi:MAG: hypothetical protein AAB887_00920 [Patescibacteria group bacterium]